MSSYLPEQHLKSFEDDGQDRVSDEDEEAPHPPDSTGSLQEDLGQPASKSTSSREAAVQVRKPGY